MLLVYCMAGLYKRFRDAGYLTPKFLLPWEGRPALDHVIGTMYDASVFSDVVLVANQRDQPSADSIRRVMAAHNIPPNRLTFVPDTRGQAETALLGLDHLDRIGASPDRPVLFHNIDTVLIGRDYRTINRTLHEAHGYIDVFDADSPAYSYVSADAAGRVSKIAEKIVISRHATTGLYGFASARVYREHAGATAYRGEFYISDVYRSMLEAERDIRINTSSTEHRTIIVGTPAEYEALVGPEAGHARSFR